MHETGYAYVLMGDSWCYLFGKYRGMLVSYYPGGKSMTFRIASRLGVMGTRGTAYFPDLETLMRAISSYPEMFKKSLDNVRNKPVSPSDIANYLLSQEGI
jgi:hypothetical protein